MRYRLIVLLGICSIVLLSGMSTATIWPYYGIITYPYGPRCVTSGSLIHAGLDIDVPSTAVSIVATNAGVVLYAGVVWTGYGASVVIVHGQSAYWTGYHEFNSEDDLLVLPGNSVAEGQAIGTMHGGLYGVLHFNYWTNTPVNDDNTRHPLRLLGPVGGLGIDVYSNYVPDCGLRVSHSGSLVKVQVGLTRDQYDLSAYWLYTWNYEGNVRGYEEGDPYGGVLGDCSLYDPNNREVGIGTARVDYYPYSNEPTYFAFPCQVGDWISNWSWLTFAESVNGTTVTLPMAIEREFVSAGLACSGDCIVVSARLRDDAVPNVVAVYRSKNDDAFVRMCDSMHVAQDGKWEYRDCNEIGPGDYVYRLEAEYGTYTAMELLHINIPDGPPGVTLFVYPNPVGRVDKAATIGYSTGSARILDLAVYDIRGRRVRKLGATGGGAGHEFTQWNVDDDRGKRVPASCYIVRIETERGVRMRKVVVQ